MSPADEPEARPAAADDPAARRLQTLPFAALVLALAMFIAAGGDHRLTAEALRVDAVALADWAGRFPFLAPLAVALGAASVAAIAAPGVSIAAPGAAVIAMAGGVMLGPVGGAIAATLGATAGAVVLMGASRAALRPMVRRNESPWLIRAEQALQRDGFHWMLALRLALPFVPFAVTLFAAGLGVRMRPFLAATALGTLPGAFLLAQSGAALAAGGPARADLLLAWPVPLVSLGLALLALSPMVAGWIGRRSAR